LLLHHERLGKLLLDIVGVSLSVGIGFWVAHGAFGFFSMADYSRANKDIKHVLKLSAYSFPSEYYDWEDDMEKFLWGRGLNSAMQLFYAKKIFSEVLFVMVA
jgi:hypothetical protein